MKWTLSLSGQCAPKQDQVTFTEGTQGFTIRLLKDQFNTWCPVKGDWVDDGFENSLGQIAFRGGIVVFEPFVKGACINPVIPEELKHDNPPMFHTPRSRKGCRKHIFLRTGDSIEFSEHSLEIMFVYHLDGGAPTKTKGDVKTATYSPVTNVKSEVEVASSAAGHDPFMTFGGDASLESAEASISPEAVGMPIKSPKVDQQQQATPDRELFSTARTTGVVQETPQKPGAEIEMVDADTDDEQDLDRGTHPIADSHPIPTLDKESMMQSTDGLSQSFIKYPARETEHTLPRTASSPTNGADENGLQPYESIEAQAVTPSVDDGPPKGTQDNIILESGLMYDGGRSQKPGDETDNKIDDFPDLAEVTRTTNKKRKANEADVEDKGQTSSATSSEGKQLRSVSRTRQVTGVLISPSPALSDKSEIFKGKSPRILFSNSDVEHKPELMKFLRSQKAIKTEDSSAKGSDILCVGLGEVKTTAKVLMSLVLDKQIVTDEWVVASQKAGHLLNTKSFSPSSLFATRQSARNDLWAEKTVCFTQSAKKGYGSAFETIVSILKHAGATTVMSATAREIKDKTNAVVIGLESKDNDVGVLAKSGIKCFRKEIISASIMANELNLDDDEFLVHVDEPEAPNAGKKRKTN